MDINFTCPNCSQLLTADDSMIGAEIACPSCNETIIVQAGPGGSGGKLTVPSGGKASEELIKKPNRPMEAVAKASIKLLQRTILRNECVVEGKDRFDQTVTEFLSSLGEGHFVSLHPIQYTRVDAETKQPVIDYGVIIVYKSL
ncbi:MAG: hypothetical protein AB1705_01745 [Verrucomicrobiota bacterium]